MHLDGHDARGPKDCADPDRGNHKRHARRKLPLQIRPRFADHHTGPRRLDGPQQRSPERGPHAITCPEGQSPVHRGRHPRKHICPTGCVSSTPGTGSARGAPGSDAPAGARAGPAAHGPPRTLHRGAQAPPPRPAGRGAADAARRCRQGSTVVRVPWPSRGSSPAASLRQGGHGLRAPSRRNNDGKGKAPPRGASSPPRRRLPRDIGMGRGARQAGPRALDGR